MNFSITRNYNADGSECTRTVSASADMSPVILSSAIPRSSHTRFQNHRRDGPKYDGYYQSSKLEKNSSDVFEQNANTVARSSCSHNTVFHESAVGSKDLRRFDVSKSVDRRTETELSFSTELSDSSESGYGSCVNNNNNFNRPGLSCGPETHIERISRVLKQVVNEQKCLDDVFIHKICKRIGGVVKNHLQASGIKLYGSYLSGFAIANSDINLELSMSATSIDNKFLLILSKLLDDNISNFHVHFNEATFAKQSFITCIEPEQGTRCVIRFLGQDSSYYRLSQLLRNICLLDPLRIQTLVVSLRHWAEVCAVHEDENGRLHPVALVLMVIHFLQQVKPPIVPIIDVDGPFPKLLVENNRTVGELWIELLKYYGVKFNWRDHVISITSLHLKEKSSFKWEKCWIGIESPYDERANIAKSVVSQDVSMYIQQCFEKTYAYFSNSPSDGDDKANKSCGTGDSDQRRVLSPAEHCDYSFSTCNFTRGLEMPSMCLECVELGYTCPDCATDALEEEYIEPLPEITTECIDNISMALQEASNIHLLSDEEILLRQNLVKDIEVYVRKCFNGAKLQLMGSSVNGFGFKNSDLDICLTFSIRDLGQIVPQKTIRHLCFHLRKNPAFKSVFAVYSAKIPVIQFHHGETNLRGDISMYNLLAVHNTRLLHCYSKIDRRVRILGCAMKLLAKNACIADTTQNSLSSYSYILMVIHFLQRTVPPILPVLQELYDGTKPPVYMVEGYNVWFFQVEKMENLERVWKNKTNTMSVGELWLEFLKYYTETYNAAHVITINQSKKITSSNIQSHARLFNIQDPFITTKNLGSVMSEGMSSKTWRTLLRARKLFGRCTKHVPSGFQSFQEFLFHPMCLTDGRVMKCVECTVCGKMGHRDDKCARVNVNFLRGRGRGRHFASRGVNHQGTPWRPPTPL